MKTAGVLDDMHEQLADPGYLADEIEQWIFIKHRITIEPMIGKSNGMKWNCNFTKKSL